MTYTIRPTPDGYALLYGDRIVISPLELLDACAVWWGCMADEIERVVGDGRNGDTATELGFRRQHTASIALGRCY